MKDKQIIIDGLSCDNCPEAKRCQEQQAKKEYATNQVLQDIPSEYANVIVRLKQIIPSVTRCDYVLEQQLKAKEQELEQYKRSKQASYELLQQECNKVVLENRRLKVENEEFKNKLAKCLTDKREKEIIIDQLKASLEEKNKFLERLGISASGEFHRIKYYVNKLVAENEKLKALCDTYLTCYRAKHSDINCLFIKYKQTLDEIKDIVQFSNRPYKLCGEYNECCDVLNKIWNKISEVDNESYLDNHWLFTENKKGEN